LLLFGHRNSGERSSEALSGGSFRAVLERMKGWFQGNF